MLGVLSKGEANCPIVKFLETSIMGGVSHRALRGLPVVAWGRRPGATPGTGGVQRDREDKCLAIGSGVPYVVFML